jgi:hypothetical protein
MHDGTNDGAAGARRDVASESDGVASMDALVRPDSARDASPAGDAAADRGRHDAGSVDTSQDGSGTDVADDGASSIDGAPTDAPLDVPSCDLEGGRSPTDNPCLIDERFGVFVSPSGSDATGAGTRAAPFRTLPRALQIAKVDMRRVYACDNGTGFDAGVTLDVTLDGMELFGGFDCGTWKLTPVGRTAIRTASGPALTARGLIAGVTFDRFDFASADAAIGASSIAVLLDASANVTLRKARIVAGRGGSGQPGAPGDPGTDGNVAGPEQDGAPGECSVDPAERPGGAWAQASLCGSRGGTGLPSNAQSDQQAESGIPMTGVTPANQTNGGGGFLGLPAGPGSPGNRGNLGAPAVAAGAFSASGYTPAPAALPGTEGHTGQGGGGGIKGVVIWHPCNVSTGGAGGMGGCGGRPGTGGAGGGASVGVLSWSSSVLFDQCEIVAAAGGAGGKGGDGGKGGLGMPGGRGGAAFANDAGVFVTAAENGGKGGNGGDGGSGAGGNGGPSHALVYTGTRPVTKETILGAGPPGASGVGGTAGGVKAPDGAVGASGPELKL